MKLAATLFYILVFVNVCFAQTQHDREISPFTRVEVLDEIDLVLQQGETPKLQLEYHGIDPCSIITENKGNKLTIYLDTNAQPVEGAQVTAYVTYATLKELTVIGSSHVVNNSPIKSDRFVLRSFGSNDVFLEEVQARKWKAAFYGENRFSVGKGKVTVLRVKEYGNNKLNFRQVASDMLKVVPWVIIGNSPGGLSYSL
ncbi:GIN domain-containing protein [Tunicatimonas pelagia]|uniref:GIN domain-containing protein n=1 Tax=Tunicatimonas pelagia TaxID=931531 RepID=UPI0026663027|nr:DUF2807 domain-containing protein [Tunicatimonas pelagia]WKN43084.1 DUF2807 domain-containing protein [Tunicatimonas pelagia]